MKKIHYRVDRLGQQMIRDSAATIKRLSMELGNAPVIVWPDADIDKALDLGSHQIYQQRPCVTCESFLCP